MRMGFWYSVHSSGVFSRQGGFLGTINHRHCLFAADLKSKFTASPRSSNSSLSIHSRVYPMKLLKSPCNAQTVKRRRSYRQRRTHTVGQRQF